MASGADAVKRQIGRLQMGFTRNGLVQFPGRLMELVSEENKTEALLVKEKLSVTLKTVMGLKGKKKD